MCQCYVFQLPRHATCHICLQLLSHSDRKYISPSVRLGQFLNAKFEVVPHMIEGSAANSNGFRLFEG